MDANASSYTQPMTGTKMRYADTAPQIVPVRAAPAPTLGRTQSSRRALSFRGSRKKGPSPFGFLSVDA